MNKIILATDGSTFSDAAARYLADNSLLNHDLTVHVVHCEPDVTGDIQAFVSRSDIDAWHHDKSRQAMQSVVDILQAGGLAFECHELTGFTPERIVEYAAEIGSAAIVMGSHHRNPVVSAIIGSVSGRVLAHAPCPVLLV